MTWLSPHILSSGISKAHGTGILHFIESQQPQVLELHAPSSTDSLHVHCRFCLESLHVERIKLRTFYPFPDSRRKFRPRLLGNRRGSRLSRRAELGPEAPPPACNSSQTESSHCRLVTSSFLFSADLPFARPFVPQTTSWTVHPASQPESHPAGSLAPAPGPPFSCADWPLLGHSHALGRQDPRPSGKFSLSGGSGTFGDSEKATPEAAVVWEAMEEPPLREEEEEEEEEADEAGPEGALDKSPFHLTTEDVYDISYVVGRELMALGSDPRVTQLQFKIVRVLEMLETLVNEGNVTVEELRMERDNLKKEVERLRGEGSAASPEVSAGRRGLGRAASDAWGQRGSPTGREAPFLSPTSKPLKTNHKNPVLRLEPV